MPKKEKILCKVRISDLSYLFNRCPETIRRWVRQGILDPTNLHMIIKKYIEVQEKKDPHLDGGIIYLHSLETKGV